MDVKTYQMKAGRTINWNLNPTQQILHALHGMSGEVGEIHSLYQKVYQGHTFDDEHLKKEIGDLLWFISEFCTANGYELSEVMDMNIKKLEKRFPNGFDEQKSLHREKDDI